jgi:hypothetical protein
MNKFHTIPSLLYHVPYIVTIGNSVLPSSDCDTRSFQGADSLETYYLAKRRSTLYGHCMEYTLTNNRTEE